MKKLAAVFLAFTLVFSSFGGALLFAEDTAVEAKSYKSGKKGFSNSNSNNIQQDKKDNDTKQNSNATQNNNNTTKTDKNTTPSKGGFMSGGLMKGLMLGGLAGLLFGSLFGDLGVLGSILGLLINGIAIIAVIVLVVKIVQLFTRKKDKEKEATQWKN